ncbi:hypothetical protein C2G38_1177743 [Gigaspora rosea]|uniref:Uncharacterized protein n=1 Tax=Gigaspora rosea TaxID=44941 RepID=A0A397VDT3_9GLOM|nr:hypothetical protein C2G38_1177743 [Gigaspora rosea]
MFIFAFLYSNNTVIEGGGGADVICTHDCPNNTYQLNLTVLNPPNCLLITLFFFLFQEIQVNIWLQKLVVSLLVYLASLFFRNLIFYSFTYLNFLFI